MYCSYCGHNNPNGARFCSGCGAALPQGGSSSGMDQDAKREVEGYASYTGEPDPYAQAGQPFVPGDPTRNWAGTTGFVLGLLSLVLTPVLNIASIPGFIISILGLRGQCRGLSVAGLVLSILGFLVGVFLLLVVIGLFSEVSRMDSSQFHDFYDQFDYYYHQMAALIAALHR